jgi:hypothetical protein
MLARDLQYFSRRGGEAPGVYKLTAPAYSFVPGVELVLSDVSAAVTIVLLNARSVVIGKPYAVKDVSGTAQTNNITVKPPEVGQTIDGVSQFVLQWNYAGQSFISDGANWFLSPT